MTNVATNQKNLKTNNDKDTVFSMHWILVPTIHYKVSKARYSSIRRVLMNSQFDASLMP